MTRRTTLTLVSAFAIAGLALTSCSSSGAPGASSSGGGGGGEAITLQAWTFKQSHVEALQAVAEQCFPDGNVTLEVEAITPDDAFTTAVQAAVQTRELPDLVMAHSMGEDWLFAQAGILQDITEHFESNLADRFSEHTLSQIELTQAVIDGRGDDPATTIRDLEPGSIYSVPLINGAANVVIGNRSILEEAGVDTSEPPATWEEWVADMEQVESANPDVGGLVTGMQIPQVGYFWLYGPMASAYLGPEAVMTRTSEQMTPAWNSPESVRTIELWDMLTPHWAPGVQNLGIDQADQAFAAGDAAYDMGGTFTVPFLLQQGMSIDDLMIFQSPPPEGSAIMDGTMQTNPLVSTGVTTTSEHPEEALAFIDCLSSPEGAATFMNTAGDLVAAQVETDQIESESLRALVDLFDREGAEVLNPPATFQTEPTTGDPVGQTSTILAQVAADELDPQQAADRLMQVYEEAWAAEP